MLSATKLLKRIIAPDAVGPNQTLQINAENLHNHTYGISTDPITQFAVVFSALIHDVGHCGVGNEQLAREDPALAEHYGCKSIAEQRSLDVAWELLLLPRFVNLRRCIYRTKEECERFCSLVVNSVMATDIFDKELKEDRNDRWDQSFVASGVYEMADNDLNRKATIVIEHIIQASDVAHTMQHWYVYQKWNEYLFQEMYINFLCGRSAIDPTEGWYKGELWFFDNYVIPLANKLKECGVFGVSSDENLIYATENRREWERKGHELVKQFQQSALDLATTLCIDTNVSASSQLEPASPHPTSNGTKFTSERINETFTNSYTVVDVPPGQLKIVVEATDHGHIIHEIYPASPLYGKVNTGAIFNTVDDISCIEMPHDTFLTLMDTKCDQPRRICFANAV
jgi:hypothetical protein